MKKYRENGDRDPFSRSSNPHSIGLALSEFSFLSEGVWPHIKMIVISNRPTKEAVIKISQNI